MMIYFHLNTNVFFLFFIIFAIDSAAGTPLSAPESSQEQQHLPDNHYRPDTLAAVFDALSGLQDENFQIWPGVWPSAIDWTAAVIGTSISGALSTFSASFPPSQSPNSAENFINRYFSQISASYFGQDILAIRQEANDDALWVVLEWLEGIKFIDEHSTYYSAATPGDPWYGHQWVPPFAHRARLFWELAAQGWNTTLCDGGMLWNPRLLPYKNAITNELYISASVAMYLNFPGDKNASPFDNPVSNHSMTESFSKPYDPKYLSAAVDAYKWLKNSNMTNAQGLYVDGFHISGWKPNITGNTNCDERNEMVYTYNQGVLLSGLHGLYHATGARSYLEDGHKLVANVIAATGWDLDVDEPSDSLSGNGTSARLGKWHGLGRSGILEEACDSSATCSQDSQTFKGIFFHHLTQFCFPLSDPFTTTEDFTTTSPENTQTWHSESCNSYGAWIKHNAKAALNTLDSQGRFGGWWGAPVNTTLLISSNTVELPAGAIDYRNLGIPPDWISLNPRRDGAVVKDALYGRDGNSSQTQDLNDRGRGRTVETQIGGLNVLRALWEIVDSRKL